MKHALDTIKLVDESVRSGLSPSTEESVAAINSLYITRSGYTQEQVDEAGQRFFQTLQNELQQAMASVIPKNLSSNVNLVQTSYGISDPAYRLPIAGRFGQGQVLQIVMQSPRPAQATLVQQYGLWLPRDAAGDDDILLKGMSNPPRTNPPDTVVARMDEIVPAISGILQIRLKMTAERILGEMLAELKLLAEKALRTGP